MPLAPSTSPTTSSQSSETAKEKEDECTRVFLDASHLISVGVLLPTIRSLKPITYFNVILYTHTIYAPKGVFLSNSRESQRVACRARNFSRAPVDDFTDDGAHGVVDAMSPVAAMTHGGLPSTPRHRADDGDPSTTPRGGRILAPSERVGRMENERKRGGTSASASPNVGSRKRVSVAKKRATRTGAVSARTRQALMSGVLKWDSEKGVLKEKPSPARKVSKPHGTGRKSGGLGGDALAAKVARALASSRNLVETSGRVGVTKGGDEAKERRETKRRLEEERALVQSVGVKRSRQSGEADTSGNSSQVHLPQVRTGRASKMKQLALGSARRLKAKPFEQIPEYQPDNVLVCLNHNSKSAKEWCTNERIFELCAPGSLLDISDASLQPATKAVVARALRDDIHGNKTSKYIRVKVIEHFLDTKTGWTYSTVQVVSKRTDAKGAKRSVPSREDELVFNLTEEAAYGCLRLHRLPLGEASARNMRKLSTESPSSQDTAEALQPSTPPHARNASPPPKKKKTQKPSTGTSEAALQEEYAKLYEKVAEFRAEHPNANDSQEEAAAHHADESPVTDVSPESDEDQLPSSAVTPPSPETGSVLPTDRMLRSLPDVEVTPQPRVVDDHRLEFVRSSPAQMHAETPVITRPFVATNHDLRVGRLEGRPMIQISDNALPGPMLSIGEIGGVESSLLNAPRFHDRLNSPLLDNGQAQLEEFYERMQQRMNMHALSNDARRRTTDPEMFLTDTYLTRCEPLRVAMPPPRITAPPPESAGPMVYYVPVPVVKNRDPGVVTEVVVGGVRLKVIQEPLVAQDVHYHPMVAETDNTRATDSDALSNVRLAREHQRQIEAQPIVHRRAEFDDETALAANLLMLRQSYRSLKKPTKSKSKPRKQKSSGKT